MAEMDEHEAWRELAGILFKMNPKQNLTILGPKDAMEIVKRLREDGYEVVRIEPRVIFEECDHQFYDHCALCGVSAREWYTDEAD